MRSKLIGRFSIRLFDIEEKENEVKEILNQCIVVRAEVMYDRDCIEYTAICDQFDVLQDGMMTPYYNWINENGKWVAKKDDHSD